MWTAPSQSGPTLIYGYTWAQVPIGPEVIQAGGVAYHPVTGKFGSMCVEKSGSLRLYESLDGISWTRASQDTSTSIGANNYLSQGPGNNWFLSGVNSGTNDRAAGTVATGTVSYFPLFSASRGTQISPYVYTNVT